MDRRVSEKRPWLAALLGAAATGLGHLYLRRWLRAIGWVAVAYLATALFVPDSALAAFGSGGRLPWLDLLPLMAVSIASALDAYRLAVVDNYLRRLRSRDVEDAPTVCSSCGRPADEDLDFCQWCATPLDGDAE